MKKSLLLVFVILSIAVMTYAGPLVMFGGSGGGSVFSVFGRTGTVLPQAGDYVDIYESDLGSPAADGYC